MIKDEAGYFAVEEIKEFLDMVKNKSPAFWGETGQGWQNGQIVWWKEAGIIKPKKKGGRTLIK